jgi:succinate-semialdehyde dehydrogenase/glutarate-semialdehyde dehydrogenase
MSGVGRLSDGHVVLARRCPSHTLGIMTSLPDPAAAAGLADSGPTDPEHDLTASYALEPAYARRLTDRVLATTGRTVATYSPVTGQPLAMIPQSGSGDVAEAYRRARRAQAAWAATPLDVRAAKLLALHDLILDRQGEIIDLICWESGKARKHAFDEPMHVALTARYYARTAHQHLDTRRRAGAVPGLTRVDVNRVPKGVVGVISPWNYPFTMALCDGLPALLAGNAVVTKPDAQTMLSALLGAELLEQAGFPRDLWVVVAGPGREIGGPMIEHSDYVCFTGSTATGKIIARQCADRLIGCSLELGGKNPLLVLRDADVEKAAEGAVRASFSNAGQLCVSMERMYVADQIYDRFMARFVEHTRAMRLRPGPEWGSDMGSLISADQLATVVAHVDDAVAKGARVLTGGKARPDLGPYYYEPTILEGVTPEMTCFGDETFGPVIAVYRFHDEADAVARANAGDYGLNASIYSQDGSRARELARRIKCGTVNINEAFSATFASIDSPMGGMRQSGMGRRQGSEGIHRYTESQSVATQRLVRFAPVLGMSDQSYAKVMTLSLRLMKKMGFK